MNPQDLVQRWSKEEEKFLLTRTSGSTEEEVEEFFLWQVSGKSSEVKDLTEYFAVKYRKCIRPMISFKKSWPLATKIVVYDTIVQPLTGNSLRETDLSSNTR